MLLRIKDIREVLEKTLSMFYAFPDFSIGSTKAMDQDKVFRIEFRIYDTEFWMDVDPAIDSVRISTRTLGVPTALDTIEICLQEPYQYNTERFEFGWRSDLEWFFDGLQAYLKERVEKMHNPPADKAAEPNIKIGPFKEDNLMKYLEEEEAASYEEYIADAKGDEAKTGETKPSIFNSLKKDYEELLAQGMDEDDAMNTALDKYGIYKEDDEDEDEYI